jgi:hypothetical protein
MSLLDRLRAFVHPEAAFAAGWAAAHAKFDTERYLWTDRGHRLVAELENLPEWVVETDGKVVTFVDKWVDKITGAVVSQAAHTLNHRELVAGTVAGDVNGGAPPTSEVSS